MQPFSEFFCLVLFYNTFYTNYVSVQIADLHLLVKSVYEADSACLDM